MEAAAKTGELALGYDASPLHPSGVLPVSNPGTPAPSSPAASVSPLPRHLQRPPPELAIHSSSYSPFPLSPTSPSSYIERVVSCPKASKPHDKPAAKPSPSSNATPELASDPVRPSPSSAPIVTQISSTTPMYPEPFIGPLPSVPRHLRVGKRNRYECYVVWKGLRPGIYYTWYVSLVCLSCSALFACIDSFSHRAETFAQIDGLADAGQCGCFSLQLAVERYHTEGRLGNVKVLRPLP